MSTDLDARLLAAHETGDGAALVRLYTEAGSQAESRGDIDAACFYLTHAMVHALEQGDPAAALLRARLAQYGRESPE